MNNLTNNKQLLDILDGKINITHTAFRGKYMLDWEDIIEVYEAGAQSRLQAIAEEVEELKCIGELYNSHNFKDEVLQIIQQHLD